MRIIVLSSCLLHYTVSVFRQANFVDQYVYIKSPYRHIIKSAAVDQSICIKASEVNVNHSQSRVFIESGAQTIIIIAGHQVGSANYDGHQSSSRFIVKDGQRQCSRCTKSAAQNVIIVAGYYVRNANNSHQHVSPSKQGMVIFEAYYYRSADHDHICG
ncbi:hypothetical protein DPMN_187081 [Dreissena polymorpha]|uniref:Uncharacterized protein n=1 Tax=Dreissena polymorpha TaxID=45954 RepID=A0A9D4DRG2_DREPO|nr:hypothetical protein DPMN_187081 [Dreissena polymorpha]